LNIDDDDDLSVPLDNEDMEAIAALSVSEVAAIDQAILSTLTDRWQKTAMIIGRAMYAYPDRFDDIPDVFYGQRVLQLASDGLLSSQGNLRRMRFSEVRKLEPDDVAP
jgi:hypothetical protein